MPVVSLPVEGVALKKKDGAPGLEIPDASVDERADVHNLVALQVQVGQL